MKDFCAGSLKTSGFCFALDDYRALIGEERFKVLKVNYAAFILDEDDTMPSIKVVLDLMIWEDFKLPYFQIFLLFLIQYLYISVNEDFLAFDSRWMTNSEQNLPLRIVLILN